MIARAGRPRAVPEGERSRSLQYYYDTCDEKRKQRRAANLAAYRAKMAKLRAYLEEHPCVDCEEADPVVLTFDHVRGEKLGTISDLLRKRGWEVVVAEIKKCEVRCANCHLRRHARDRKPILSISRPN